MSFEAVALSGGKDSTAMALRLEEVEPNPDREFIITPTGDELPDMADHWDSLEQRLGKPLVRVAAPTLRSLIDHYGALPNFRARWCTRQIKVEPCVAYLVRKAIDLGAKPVLCVGLRGDEEERRGLYSDLVVTRFPLREWGWGIDDVLGYLRGQGVKVPQRTDCARCYGQRLGEWWDLWKDYPELFADAEADEARVGHTFRSPGRDSWPAALADLRAEFERGRTPRGARLQLPMFEDETPVACRICRM